MTKHLKKSCVLCATGPVCSDTCLYPQPHFVTTETPSPAVATIDFFQALELAKLLSPLDLC